MNGLPQLSVPTRAALLVGLAAVALAAVVRPVAPVAAISLPLALVLPGIVLQRRLLPRVDTDVAAVWCLRVVASLAYWALVVLGVGAAQVPVNTGWPVLIGVVVLASLVIGDPQGSARWGRTSGATAVGAGVAVVVALVVALAGRGLSAVAGGGTGGGTGSSGIVLAFAAADNPLDLAATGAQGAMTVTVDNASAEPARVTVTGQVGAAPVWSGREVTVAPGATVKVTVTGSVRVCRDVQQAVVTVRGDATAGVTPLSTFVPGVPTAPACPR